MQAARGPPSSDHFGESTSNGLSLNFAEEEIDKEETAFMDDFFSLLEAAHFRVLSRDDWDAAMENDFTVSHHCSLLMQWLSSDGKS